MDENNFFDVNSAISITLLSFLYAVSQHFCFVEDWLSII